MEQKLDRRLELADSPWTTARVHLDTIPSSDKALLDIGKFSLVILHLFSAGGRYLSDAVDILRRIERVEELHTKGQWMISPPYLSTTLLCDVLQRWILYLNRYVAAWAFEALEGLGANTPLSLEPILVYLEGEQYVGPILPGPLADLLAGHRPDRGGGNGGVNSGEGVLAPRPSKASYAALRGWRSFTPRGSG